MRLPPHTLRGRLITGVLVLLALACAAIGVATTIGLGRFLTERIDQQLAANRNRFAASLEHEQEFEGGDTRGQAVGTLAARLVDGRLTHAAVVTDRVTGTAPTLSAADRATLAALPADGVPHSMELSALDDYRILAAPGQDGDVLLTGLPLRAAEETVRRLIVLELALFAAVLTVTGVAGTLWVRLSLRPLSRVAATARRVSELPLASGEVALPERVQDADPRSEIGQVAAAFNRMLGHVENALARRHTSEQRLRGFAADASHELRTPLAAIRGHVELALRDDGLIPEQIRHSLTRIEAESGRMGELVDELLLLARLDGGRPLAAEEVDLTRLAIEVTTDAQVAGPGHRWVLDLPEEPVVVRGDRLRLHQVLANLLANARIHTPPGTRVAVTVRRLDHQAELIVTDDGPGIPADRHEEIFERFSRGDQGRSRTSGGSGLGLAIVRAVTTAHGGTVEVESRPGRTAFRLLLPAAQP
ncbi:HAMP domain-containing sensor histidine kinase [Acrocarpospora macrocephala]|uniref:histidine kinase n=1 Tax=Acrocarpospora macrocephala TaxID=150177 RepID=A0A5M3WSY0_9ACTN|nr:HAMP domain-containing sensor histidine kinase [Acrocarpospora macrocephala]GES09753.1 sensor histidine kinase [Acrocarpospora macrocephala]